MKWRWNAAHVEVVLLLVPAVGAGGGPAVAVAVAVSMGQRRYEQEGCRRCPGDRGAGGHTSRGWVLALALPGSQSEARIWLKSAWAVGSLVEAHLKG